MHSPSMHFQQMLNDVVAWDVMRARTSLRTSQSSVEPQSESGCHTRCYGPISETARFPSFLACKFIWIRQPDMAGIIKIRSMPMDLECFCITMATVLNFFKFLFRVNVLGPDTGLPTKFRQDLLRIAGGVR